MSLNQRDVIQLLPKKAAEPIDAFLRKLDRKRKLSQEMAIQLKQEFLTAVKAVAEMYSDDKLVEDCHALAQKFERKMNMESRKHADPEGKNRRKKPRVSPITQVKFDSKLIGPPMQGGLPS